jgi:hypothetical protein
VLDRLESIGTQSVARPSGRDFEADLKGSEDFPRENRGWWRGGGCPLSGRLSPEQNSGLQNNPDFTWRPAITEIAPQQNQ